jgi:hypothetical protein
MPKNVSEMSVREMREELQSLGISVADCIEKGDFVEKLTAAREESIKRTGPASKILIELTQFFQSSDEHL